MTPENLKTKLETDPNFILLKRFNYSLKDLLKRYPDGCPDHIIAQALGTTEEDVEEIYQGIVIKLRAQISGEAV